MMLGGSPHIVAAPPRFAQNTSEIIIGIGSNFKSCASSTVTAARNRITVMLSMNIDRNADITIKTMNKEIGLYFTSFASLMQSQRKNPAFAMPSTIIIIPARKMIVAQLMPLVDSSAPAEYQKDGVNIVFRFSVCIIADGLCMQIPNTITSVRIPQPIVT